MMARERNLPMRAETMGFQLLNRALSSTRQLCSGAKLSEDQAKRGMQDLKERELVTSIDYGCRLSMASHHYFTEKGLDFFAASDQQRSWHSQDAIGNLLVYDLPKVEAVLDIALRVSTDSWPLASIQWYERKAMAAVAAYGHPGLYSPAYQVFCVPSIVDNQWELCSRLGQLPGELLEQARWPPAEHFSAIQNLLQSTIGRLV